MPLKDLKKRKEYQRKAGRDHYEKNKQDYIERAAERKKVHRAAWSAFKSSLSCVYCGFSHPQALDFHHIIKTNHRKVHKLASDGSLKAAMDEIKKCICLCSNCHRVLHNDPVFERKVYAKVEELGLFSREVLRSLKTSIT